MFKPSSRNLYRSVVWIGDVETEAYQATLAKITEFLQKNRREPMNLIITSTGGSPEIAYAFYDMVNFVLKPKLNTLATGEASSSAVILYLSATGKRYATPHTFFLLHEISRHFSHARLTTPELSACLREHHELTDWYADLVSKATNRKLKTEKVKEMMKDNTILNAEQALKLGIVHKIIE